MNIQDIAIRANEAAAESSSMGSVFLVPDSPVHVLLDWLNWCDPNGEWEGYWHKQADFEGEAFTAADAWTEIATMLDGAS